MEGIVPPSVADSCTLIVVAIFLAISVLLESSIFKVAMETSICSCTIKNLCRNLAILLYYDIF
jgi:hypothetical protein